VSEPKDVETYIAEAAGEARPILKEFREIIKSTVPQAEEGISWGMPFYKYHGPLARFTAYKRHVSFGFGDALKSSDKRMLAEKGYETVTKIIKVKFDQKVPTTAIKQLLKAQAKRNEVKRR
jgi:uncharacterized protein YdhG (YjbR/CyaY superfamily)